DGTTKTEMDCPLDAITDICQINDGVASLEIRFGRSASVVLYGYDDLLLANFEANDTSKYNDLREAFAHHFELTESTSADKRPTLEKTNKLGPVIQKAVFIGHGGKSQEWLVLQRFLETRLKLITVEFNSECAVSRHTTARLEE